MIKAHKIRLNPTDEQIVYFRKACGTRRFAYNWGVEVADEKPVTSQETIGIDLGLNHLATLSNGTDVKCLWTACKTDAGDSGGSAG